MAITAFKGPCPAVDRGFTIVEMMIALCIFAIIATSIVGSYQSQQFSYVRQEKMAEAQQNIRAALFFLERDIRRFGYDPSERASSPTSTSMVATVSDMRFVWDANENGVIENSEIIRYILGPTATTDPASIAVAADSTGRCPAGTNCSLKRAIGSSAPIVSAIADNVQGLEFFYHFADGTTATTCTSQARRENIRSVDVSILVRSKEILQKQKDTATYRTASGAVWGPFNDSYIRRMMITNIKCRNMGLEG